MNQGAVDWEKMRAADIVSGVRQIVEMVMQIDYRELELALRLVWDDPATTEREKQVMMAFHKFRYELERERLMEIVETRDEAAHIMKRIKRHEKAFANLFESGGDTAGEERTLAPRIDYQGEQPLILALSRLAKTKEDDGG